MKKVLLKTIGNLQFRFTSDIHKSEVLDTKVEIVGKDNLNLLVCFLEGRCIEDFIGDLECFMNKYLI